MTDRWIILRTSGGQTLPLARSLLAAGYAVWTPARTLRRRMPAKTACGYREVEADVPILPTFVFARERDLIALVGVAGWTISPHPAFSVFHHAGRVPLIADREVVGLREEEARAAATIQAIRDAETHDEAERVRIAALKTEAARRRATAELERQRLAGLRSQRPAFKPGAVVCVSDMPALAGVTGVVESIDGHFAEVRFGRRSWKIEGWRLVAALQDLQAA